MRTKSNYKLDDRTSTRFGSKDLGVLKNVNSAIINLFQAGEELNEVVERKCHGANGQHERKDISMESPTDVKKAKERLYPIQVECVQNGQKHLETTCKQNSVSSPSSEIRNLFCYELGLNWVIFF